MVVFLRGSAPCVAEKAQSAERRETAGWQTDTQTERQVKGREEIGRKEGRG